MKSSEYVIRSKKDVKSFQGRKYVIKNTRGPAIVALHQHTRFLVGHTLKSRELKWDTVLLIARRANEETMCLVLDLVNVEEGVPIRRLDAEVCSLERPISLVDDFQANGNVQSAADVRHISTADSRISFQFVNRKSRLIRKSVRSDIDFPYCTLTIVTMNYRLKEGIYCKARFLFTLSSSK